MVSLEAERERGEGESEREERNHKIPSVGLAIARDRSHTDYMYILLFYSILLPSEPNFSPEYKRM